MLDKELELYETLLIKKKMKGLDDLFFFNKFVLEADERRRNLLVPHVHGEWTDWYKHSTKRIKMILVPRGCFKSTFFTIGRTLQAIAKNRNERILIANATLANSQSFLGEIKDHLRKNEEYKALYGEFYDPKLKWNEDSIEVTGRSLGNKEATVTAIGVGGNLVSQHYSKIICDDLVNLENSATRYQADKVIDWWKRAFSLLDYDGEMIIIGTRWSYYELYSWIVEKYNESIDTYIRGAYLPDKSLYFPELLNEEKLKELRGLQGSYVFSAFYLNDPVDEESALIKREQILKWGDGEKTLPSKLNVFSLCDPAISQETGADESTIMTVGVDINNDWYVLEARTGKWTVGELITEMFAVHNQWKPITMTIETIGQAQGLMTPIHDEENRRNHYLPLVEIKSRGFVTKQMRIRAVLQPRFERGKIFIKDDMFELEEQILKFPRGKRDDMIDALTDMEEVSFEADQDAPLRDTSGGFFERLLKEQEFKKIGQGDPIMGSDF